jgi:hypothetical protein
MDVRLWGRILGRIPFTDGVDRDVYEDAEGWQYVQDEDGGMVYGTWLSSADGLCAREDATRLVWRGR